MLRLLLRRNYWMIWPRERYAAWDSRGNWLRQARDPQMTPEGDWRVWLVLAGRGWGKTRTGAEDSAYFALWHPGAQMGVVAPTYADARDVCVEGPSGLLGVLPRHSVQAWNRSQGELFLTNGSQFKLFSADQPDRLRGPQFHRVWGDEFAAWERPGKVLEQIDMCLRLGETPRLVLTTTPRPTEAIKKLVARAGRDVMLTKGASEENRENLAPGTLESWRERYGDTPFARQELEAEILVDAQASIWRRDEIEDRRVYKAPQLRYTVIAIDPAMSVGEGSAETGIIVAGLGQDGHFYVLADASGKMKPEEWSCRVQQLRAGLGADLVLAEVNEGGDMIQTVLRMADPRVPFKPVRADKSKAQRAAPVEILYGKSVVHHVGRLDLLEDQMLRFTREGPPRGVASDRVDALVWAVTELIEVARTPPAEPRLRALE